MSGGYLPDGSYTEDRDEHGSAWSTMGKTLADALGLQLHSMDPGFCLIYPENRFASSVSIPSDIAFKIIELKRKADLYDKAIHRIMPA